MPNKYISLQELVASCPFSESQIRRFVKDEKIPFQQPGGENGKLIFPEDALEQLVHSTSHNENIDSLSGPEPKWKRK